MNIFFTAAFLLFTCFSLNAVSLPTIYVYDDSQAVGQAAAKKIADLIIAKQKEGQERIVIGFATGNTPIPTYAAFKKLARDNNLDLSRVITFNLDEYVGLPTSHSQSYHTFMFTHLFNDLIASEEYPKGIKRENIHIPNGATSSKKDLSNDEITSFAKQFPASTEKTDLSLKEQLWIAEERATAYEALIKELGPIDLQILGVGRNGHIGFAEPGTSFDSTTMVAKLTENTRSVNASFFDGNVEEVPEYAITMGIKTILQAKEIMLLATGSSKAEIIYQVLQSPVTTDIPCTSLWMHEKTSYILDQDADRLLREASTHMANS